MNPKELKAAGMKVTLPRIKILDIMENAEDPHLTADDVYRQLLENGENIGLATVYRVLMQLSEAGLVHRNYFEGGNMVFELNRGDSHHDHMICLKSGRVVEFYDEQLEQLQLEIAKKHGFKLTDHTMILYGEFIGDPEKNS
ncbi:MAG: ferric iron uptake transcriptional regulator [Gammaproteobacteria bacterium]|nr:ferric iron uptake transcriptional regulator [Gammaproteobacteria bacterium]